MNRLVLTLSLLLILVVPRAWGQTTKYPDPYRQTTWNNITDGVHTLGQTPAQAKLTKMKLRHARWKARTNSIVKSRKAHNKAWQKSQNQS